MGRRQLSDMLELLRGGPVRSTRLTRVYFANEVYPMSTVLTQPLYPTRATDGVSRHDRPLGHWPDKDKGSSKEGIFDIRWCCQHEREVRRYWAQHIRQALIELSA